MYWYFINVCRLIGCRNASILCSWIYSHNLSIFPSIIYKGPPFSPLYALTACPLMSYSHTAPLTIVIRIFPLVILLLTDYYNHMLDFSLIPHTNHIKQVLELLIAPKIDPYFLWDFRTYKKGYEGDNNIGLCKYHDSFRTKKLLWDNLFKLG